MNLDSDNIKNYILRNPRSILQYPFDQWTEELVTLALSKDPTLLWLLGTFPLSIEAKISAIHSNPQLITLLPHPSLSEKLAAVQIDGMLLSCIIDPTISVEIEAVRQNPAAVQFVHNLSNEFLQKAISANGKVLYYLSDPDENIINFALNLSGLNIRYLSPLTETRQMMMKALTSPQKEEVIQYFNAIDGNLFWFARHFQDAVNDAMQLGMNARDINNLLTATLKEREMEYPDIRITNPWGNRNNSVHRNSLRIGLNTNTGYLELDGIPARDYFNTLPGMECDEKEYILFQSKNRLEAEMMF